MSKDDKDKSREKNESGRDRATNSEERGKQSIDYSEGPGRNVVYDSLKPPPRPDGGNGNGGSKH